MSGMMDCCGLTDIGKRRRINEDQFLISDVRKSMRVHQTSLALDHQTRLDGGTQATLLLVADGMGGHEAGERASQLVIDTFVDYMLNHLSWFMHEGCETEEDFEQDLKAALIACQRKLNREVEAIPQRKGMGSTLTLAYIVWPRMFLVHVGDSRCYLLRDGILQLLTRDHTIANLAGSSQEQGSNSQSKEKSLSSESDLGESEGEQESIGSNILWNAIGGDTQDPHPDAAVLDLEMGDTLLLCTDGLTKHVRRQQLTRILSQERGTDELCRELVDAANELGGTDNITVVLSRFADRSAREREVAEVELKLDPPATELPDTGEFTASSRETIEEVPVKNLSPQTAPN